MSVESSARFADAVLLLRSSLEESGRAASAPRLRSPGSRVDSWRCSLELPSVASHKASKCIHAGSTRLRRLVATRSTFDAPAPAHQPRPRSPRWLLRRVDMRLRPCAPNAANRRIDERTDVPSYTSVIAVSRPAVDRLTQRAQRDNSPSRVDDPFVSPELASTDLRALISCRASSQRNHLLCSTVRVDRRRAEVGSAHAHQWPSKARIRAAPSIISACSRRHARSAFRRSSSAQ